MSSFLPKLAQQGVFLPNDNAWIETYTGKKFHLLSPAIEDIDIDDIAHALSLQCRWTGHCRFHYSVAQHSYYCSQLGPINEALHRLLHDSSEAYMGDMNRPLKHCTPAGPSFLEQEKIVQTAILRRFGLDPVDPPSVHIADNEMLWLEKEQIMGPLDWGAESIAANNAERSDKANIQIDRWTPEYAAMLFRARFFELYDGV